MKNLRPNWADRLVSCLAAIVAPEPGEKGRSRLRDALAEADAILAENRENMAPRLAHFLERRSYQKAHQLCEEKKFTLADQET
jgi:hypothetical protein